MSKKQVEQNLNIVDEPKSPLKVAGGSDRAAFNNHIINAAISSAWYRTGQPQEERNAIWEATTFGMMAFKPTDEIEGMIAAQAIAMHNTVMECSRRAMIPEQPFDSAQGLRKSAANASRAFTGLLDALDRKRGKGGQQKVTVEHVHVHAGGKAIVGNIAPGAPGGGGGSAGKTAGEPREPPAALEHDATLGPVLPTLRSKGAEREPVPIAGDAERAVPAARRRQHRTANG